MPLPPYQRLDPEKRAKLLRAATIEFANKGLDEASLNEILSAAGLGKSSYYYYFADKDDLFATVVEEAYSALEAKVPPADYDVPNAAAFWVAVEAHHLAWLQAAFDTPYVLELSRRAPRGRNAPNPRLEPVFERVRSIIHRFVTAGRARGFVRTDLTSDVLVALVQAADAALDEEFNTHDEVDHHKLAAHVKLAIDTSRRLLSP